MAHAPRKRSIALLTPAFFLGGGVPAVVEFLYRVLLQSGEYQPEVISFATSAHDPANMRFTSIRSWFRGIGVQTGTWQAIPYSHFGAKFGEFEFQRYQTRRALTDRLKRFDLVQVVAGTPAWAAVTRAYPGPVALQVASLTAVERQSALKAGSVFLRLWRSIMTKLTTTFENRALTAVDAVFVENRWMYDVLRQRSDAQRVIFAPPGIDTDYFQPSSYKRHGYILSVARFSDHRKNVRLLFHAYRKLRNKLPGAPKLFLAGNSAPSSQDLSLARELEIEQYIEIHQDISKERLKTLYQNAALFVLSSDEEGLGIVILEAMSSGLPVISTRCGGPETSVVNGETGYLVPVRDPVALSESIFALLQDVSLREQMSAAARNRAVERFSFAAAGKPYLEEYANLLQSPKN